MRSYLIHHLLENAVLQCPDKIALKHGDRVITYHQLMEESTKLGALIKSLDIKGGERVGILLDKSVEQVVSFFGISMSGGVSVFINPILKKEQMEHIIRDSDARTLICTKREWQRNKIDLPIKIIYMDETLGKESAERGDGINWSSVKDSLEKRISEDSQISDDIANIIYTSGSTGKPKGVVITHRNLIEGAEIVSSYLEITQEDKLLSVLPFNFDYGLNQLTTSILKAATLVLHKFFLANDLLRALEKEKITGFAGMNPIWVKIFNEKFGAKKEYDFSNLRYITNSGGKVPESTVRKMQAFFPQTKIYLMYGLTEAFRSTYLPPHELDKRPNSIGKAIPNVEILVLNEKGEECKPGEVGELVHRGALITRGYWNDPEKTEKIFRKNPLLKDQNHLNETVVFSGDLVMKDEEGFLYYVSRKDSMIKTMGYRVSPTEVEESLLKLDGVADAVVFGKEIETGDQIIVAVIQSNSKEVEEKQLMVQCKKTLPEYMLPKEFHFEKEFPKTANGKVDRSLLQKKWGQKLE
jgi:acyl-CoA ligase (AMP-forming) (exosortase A-associated)